MDRLHPGWPVACLWQKDRGDLHINGEWLPESTPHVRDDSERSSTQPSPVSENTLDSLAETQNMEVHHHGHIHHEKKWKEYLFQFIMLFLAVFSGYLAEYLLEHNIEKEREQTFIRSFSEDLEADGKDLQTLINNLDTRAKMADTLTSLLVNSHSTGRANEIYLYLRHLTRSDNYNAFVNDRTIVQLRNAGGMRLIENKDVSDSIVAYYKELETIQFLNEESITMKRSLREKFPLILDGTSFSKIIDSANQIVNPSEVLYLRSVDRNVVNACLLDINNIKGISSGLKLRIERFRNRSLTLREYISREYRLN